MRRRTAPLPALLAAGESKRAHSGRLLSSTHILPARASGAQLPCNAATGYGRGCPFGSRLCPLLVATASGANSPLTVRSARNRFPPSADTNRPGHHLLGRIGRQQVAPRFRQLRAALLPRAEPADPIRDEPAHRDHRRDIARRQDPPADHQDAAALSEVAAGLGQRRAANEWFDHTLYSWLNDKQKGAS
jgi:hypothetical protein